MLDYECLPFLFPTLLIVKKRKRMLPIEVAPLPRRENADIICKVSVAFCGMIKSMIKIIAISIEDKKPILGDG
jgi:hypothetical protein